MCIFTLLKYWDAFEVQFFQGFIFNPLSTRPHLNVVWYNSSWLGFLNILNYVPKERENFSAKKMSPHLSQLNVAMAHRNYFRQNNLQILKLATYTTILDANWQLFRLERNAKCSSFSTQNIKFYWFVMKINFCCQFDDTIEVHFLLGINILGSSSEWVK